MAASPPAANAGQAPAFADFSGFETRSLFLPGIVPPYTEPARRVMGHMSSVARYLGRRYSGLPETALVSIVLTPGADPARTAAAAQSVLGQSYRRLELLVAAGVIPATASSDSRVREIAIPTGAGIAAMRNQGLRAAAGDYLVWLDGDSMLEPQFLRILLGALLEHDPRGLAYCAQRSAARAADQPALRYAAFSRPLLENRPYFDLSCVLHARSLLDGDTPFDEQAGAQADWLFLLQLTERRAARAVPCMLSQRSETGLAPAGGDSSAVDRYLQSAGRLQQDLADSGVAGLERMYALHAPQRSRARKPVSIVIPSYECAEHLKLCVAAVQRYTAQPFELIIVDNGSSAPVREFLATLQASVARVILNPHNAGFTTAVNQGIACSAPGNDVVLLNNDAVVTPGWLEALQKVIEDVADAGLVVPRQVLLAGTDTLGVHQPACDPAREMDVNLSAHHDNIIDPGFDPVAGLMELRFAPFFCVYIPRDVIEALGPLDEQDAPHYRSDRLYCEAVRRLLKRRIVYTPHAKLYHFLQRATQALAARSPVEYDALFIRNQRPEATAP